MYKSDTQHTQKSLEDKLQSLYVLNRGAKLDLGFRPQYLRLLEKFGNPHLHLPPTIHVAGTNGKGSTIAFLRAILEAEGKHVHTYTSPHLIEFNERITLAGQPIANDNLEALIDEALRHHDGSDISFFEITTAIAFAAFARTSADILLLETGLGGRLDCTNVITNPIATIITAIGLDHQEFLGNTIESIAAEKAGIMKSGAPCIIAHQPHAQALEALKNAAQNADIRTYCAGSDWVIEADSDPDSRPLRFQFGNIAYRCRKPALQGLHQIHNAGAALAALHIIQDHVPTSYDATTHGLQHVHWPARMQNITRLTNLPTGTELWLDGGHNADAAHTIIAQARNWADKPLHIIIGMMDHKDSSTFTNHLKTINATIHNTFIPQEQESSLPHWQTIINNIIENRIPNTEYRILICGSLYLAGDVLQTLKYE